MKIYTLIGLLLFINIAGICQDKKSVGYINLSAGALKFKNIEGVPHFTFQTGIRTNSGAAFGIGSSLTKLHGDDRPFIPLFGEVSYIKYKKKIAPYTNFRIGYSIYENSYLSGFNTISIKGNFYTSLGLGLFFPIKENNAAFVVIRHIKTSLTTKSPINNSSTDLSGFSLAIGVNFN